MNLIYMAELPSLPAEDDELVELHNKETSKVKLIACASSEKADRFVELFNLVSSFTHFEAVIAQ